MQISDLRAKFPHALPRAICTFRLSPPLSDQAPFGRYDPDLVTPAASCQHASLLPPRRAKPRRPERRAPHVQQLRRPVPHYHLGRQPRPRLRSSSTAARPACRCPKPTCSPARRRRPGQSKLTTQRQEADRSNSSRHLRGRDQRHADLALVPQRRPAVHDYGDITDKFRPGHADFTFHLNTACATTAAAAAPRPARPPPALPPAASPGRRSPPSPRPPHPRRAGADRRPLIDRAAWDWDEVPRNPFWSPRRRKPPRAGPATSTA